jgi:hypothetical protein
MRSFLQQFNGCLELLRQLPPAPAAADQQQPQQDVEMAEAAGAAAAAAAAASAAGAGGASEAAGAAAAGDTVDLVKAYRQCVESVVGTFLVLMTNMRQAGWLPPCCLPAASLLPPCCLPASCCLLMPPYCCLLSAAGHCCYPWRLPLLPHVLLLRSACCSCRLPLLLACPPQAYIHFPSFFLPCSHAPMVINSPNSANLISMPVPGAGALACFSRHAFYSSASPKGMPLPHLIHDCLCGWMASLRLLLLSADC